MQDELLLTPREASRLLGVTVTTLSHWARSGRLPATLTPGGHRRYRLADLQALQATRERQVPAPAEWEDDAVRLYVQGQSIRQIAQRFDCGYGVMRRILGEHAVLRSRTVTPSRSDPAPGESHTSAGTGTRR